MNILLLLVVGHACIEIKPKKDKESTYLLLYYSQVSDDNKATKSYHIIRVSDNETIPNLINYRKARQDRISRCINKKKLETFIVRHTKSEKKNVNLGECRDGHQQSV